MNIKNVLYFLLVLVVNQPLSGQEINLPNHKNSIELGYGLLTFRELDNALLYPQSESMGLGFAKYMFSFDDKFSVGILAAYDKTSLLNSTDEDYFIETQSLLVRVEHTLVRRGFVSLYMSGGVGIQQIKKRLITGYTRQKIPAYEIVPVGLAFQFSSIFQFNLEASYGALVPAKASIAFLF